MLGHSQCEYLVTQLRVTLKDTQDQLAARETFWQKREAELLDRLTAALNPTAYRAQHPLQRPPAPPRLQEDLPDLPEFYGMIDAAESRPRRPIPKDWKNPGGPPAPPEDPLSKALS